MLAPLLRSLRPHQWAKNLFVLAPVVFAQRWLEPVAARRSTLAFAAFCAAASAVYLWNDLRDREADRRHPTKRLRPIASGSLSVSAASTAALSLGLASGFAALALGPGFSAALATYLVVNLLYSWRLKHVVILDVMLVSLGFLLRVLAGAAAVSVEVSSWLLLCTLFLSLFLVFSKRRHELASSTDAERRQVLEHYSETFLDQMINVVTASSVVSYALYAVAPETVARFGDHRLVTTMPFVLFGVFRYLYLVYQRPSASDPTEALLADVPFLVNLALWGGLVLWIVRPG